MKFVLPLIVVAALTAPGVAQDAAKATAAEAFMETPVQQNLINSILSPNAMVARLRSQGMPEDKLQIASDIISEETASIRAELRAAMIKNMAATFTIEEMDALTAFYSSPVGASASAKQQTHMSQTMQSLAPSLQAMQGRIAERLKEALQP